ncbi:MAG: P-loop NTPase [Phycisphaerae bacterium]|nr:P-loop NTPase [Phycisphaerae bacterium]
MSHVSQEQVLDALGHIMDPDLHRDIVSLGFIKNLTIERECVSFDIELTTPACPVKERFKRQAQEAVGALPGVMDVKIRMTAARKQSPMEALQEGSTLKDVGTVIAISSCKGGVGKSTIAAHIALEVARRGFRVGLLDADLYGPSIPTLFGIGPSEGVVGNKDKQLIPLERLGLKLMSFGFILKDSPAVMRGPMVSQYLMQILHHTAWGELDYLFIDMPPGTGDIQLTLTQSVPLDGAVIVTTRQALSLVDVSRGILMFEKVKVPMLGLIENMSYVLCEHCDNRNYVFGDNANASLQERFGLETLAEIPIERQLTTAIHTYAPLSHFVKAADHVIRAVGKHTRLQSQAPAIGQDTHAVTLTWPDGSKTTLDFKTLRGSCSCALCIDEMTGEQQLDKASISEDIVPEEIIPLGHYAFSVRWSDGHASSIYAYDRFKPENLKPKT